MAQELCGQEGGMRPIGDLKMNFFIFNNLYVNNKCSGGKKKEKKKRPNSQRQCVNFDLILDQKESTPCPQGPPTHIGIKDISGMKVMHTWCYY